MNSFSNIRHYSLEFLKVSHVKFIGMLARAMLELCLNISVYMNPVPSKNGCHCPYMVKHSYDNGCGSGLYHVGVHEMPSTCSTIICSYLESLD